MALVGSSGTILLVMACIPSKEWPHEGTRFIMVNLVVESTWQHFYVIRIGREGDLSPQNFESQLNMDRLPPRIILSESNNKTFAGTQSLLLHMCTLTCLLVAWKTAFLRPHQKHVRCQMEKIKGGLGDKMEDWIEKQHQMGKQERAWFHMIKNLQHHSLYPTAKTSFLEELNCGTISPLSEVGTESLTAFRTTFLVDLHTTRLSRSALRY